MKDQELKAELGDRHEELGEMVDSLKMNIQRLAKMTKASYPLEIKFQRNQTYSKWDAINEPYNVIENVLTDDEKQYKALTPNFDLTVMKGTECFIASIVIAPGDCGPQTMEVFVSQQPDVWQFVKQFQAQKKQGEQTLVLPGETVAKYVRIRCVNNVRGGNLINVRYIRINGLRFDQIPPR